MLFSLPSPSSLVLLSSRNSATMVTWRHTSLYSLFQLEPKIFPQLFLGPLLRTRRSAIGLLFSFCLFVCLFVFPFPWQQSQKPLKKSVKLPQFFSRFFSGEYEAASVVAMTSSIHKFHHVGFRHFLMNSFRRLWTTGCFVQDIFKNFSLAKTKQTAILKGNTGNCGLRQCSRLSCRNWLSRLSCNANFKRRERELKMSFHFERTRLYV